MKIEYKGGTKFSGYSRGHSIAIDLPEEMGGSDTGLMPGELLLASLGTCMGVYITRYCKTAGIDCEGMTIDLSSERAEDPARIGSIRAMVKIPGGVPEDRRTAVIKVAEHCLIHETLRNAPELTIEME
jgi:uncharacterized OsmC-like protein